MEAYIITYCILNSLYLVFAVYRDLKFMRNSDAGLEISEIVNGLNRVKR